MAAESILLGISTEDMQAEILNRLGALNVLEMAQTAVGEIKVVLSPTSTTAQIGTITTVSSVTNQTNIGGNAANTIVFDSMNLGAILGNINNYTP